MVVALCLSLTLVSCKSEVGRTAGRAVGVAAAMVAVHAARGAIAQSQATRDRLNEQWAQDRRPPVQPEAPYTGPLNEPGVPPGDLALRRAADRMRDALTLCAPYGSGRLVIEALVPGADGLPVRYELFGVAAPSTDAPCVDDALSHVRFEPFPGEVLAYWTILY